MSVQKSCVEVGDKYDTTTEMCQTFLPKFCKLSSPLSSRRKCRIEMLESQLLTWVMFIVFVFVVFYWVDGGGGHENLTTMGHRNGNPAGSEFVIFVRGV